MLGSIRYNLSHLLDFSGRDARDVLVLRAVPFLLNMAIAVVLGFVPVGSIVAPSSTPRRRSVRGSGAVADGGPMGGSCIDHGVLLASNGVMILLAASSFVARTTRTSRGGGVSWCCGAGGGIRRFDRMMDVLQDFMADAMSRTTPMSPLEMQGMMVSHNIGAYTRSGDRAARRGRLRVPD